MDTERRGAELTSLWRAQHAAGIAVRADGMPGHIAVGLAAKRITPQVSVETTVLATLLPNLLGCCWQTSSTSSLIS